MSSTATVIILPGPLTYFDPPSSCFSQTWGSLVSTASRYAIVLGNPDDPACKPSRFNTAVTYSPALCPSSYYGAMSVVSTTGSVTETVVNCCPNNFFSDGGTWKCVSTFPATLGSVTYTYTSNGATTTASRSNEAGQGLNAHSIQVRYQESDMAVLSPTSSASSSSSSSTESPTTNTLSPTSSMTSPSSSATSTPVPNTGGGLSTGAKAGLAIGIVLGVAMILAILVWFIRRQKIQKTQRIGSTHHSDADYLASNPRYEMDSSTGTYIDEGKAMPGVCSELEAPRPPRGY